MSTATREKTMEWENQIMQDSIGGERQWVWRGRSGSSSGRVYVLKHALYAEKAPTTAACGFCGIIALWFPLGWGDIWVISRCVSQQQCKHPCRLIQEPKGVAQGDTKGGSIVTYSHLLVTFGHIGPCRPAFQRCMAEWWGGGMIPRVSGLHQRPKVEPVSVNHPSLGGMC